MTERLRIGQVAPIARAVGPTSPSAIEQLVWLLTEELSRRGHEVTLFATGDSETSARLVAPYERGYRDDWRLWENWQFHEAMHIAAALEQAEEFDLLHTHTYQFPATLARLVATPVLHTDHMPADRDLIGFYARHPEARIVAVSAYQRRKHRLADIPVVHNGVDVGAFPFAVSGGDHLLFLGHPIERKGPLEAIELARRARVRLVIAGKGGDWFRERVEPLVDGHRVEYVGPVGVAERNDLLAGAGALAFTSLFGEPFGLVMVEAMACGTPVLGLDRCAVSEIVESGVTGYVAADVAALAERVPALLALDRARVRAEAERRFGHVRMADEYEAIYRRLVEPRGASAARPGRRARARRAGHARTGR